MDVIGDLFSSVSDLNEHLVMCYNVNEEVVNNSYTSIEKIKGYVESKC